MAESTKRSKELRLNAKRLRKKLRRMRIVRAKRIQQSIKPKSKKYFKYILDTTLSSTPHKYSMFEKVKNLIKRGRSK